VAAAAPALARLDADRIANVLLFWALAWWMDRRGIYLKV
jgi:predicted acyltransferase